MTVVALREIAAGHIGPEILEEVEQRPIPDMLPPDAEMSGELRAPHLGLGFGPHFCLGASLIRNEAAILLGTLARRYPDLELAADPDTLDWSGSNPLMRTVASLPMRLGARRAA